jgi:hypothetical protein
MEEKDISKNFRVTLFGEDLTSRPEKKKKKELSDYKKEIRDCSKRDCKSSAAWGFTVLSTGIILLMNTLGVITWDIWQYIWPFWPIILIFLGIDIILGKGLIAKIISSIIAISAILVITAYALMMVETSISGYLPPEVVAFINNINLNK